MSATEPQDRTKVAKVSEHRRRPPIHSSRTKPVRRVNGPAASKQRLARVRCTAPEWIATILVDKDHVTCRRSIFGEFNQFSSIWSSSCQMMFIQLWPMALTRTGEFNGRRHGQMPRDGTPYPNRHRYRSQKLRRDPGLFRTRLLRGLSDRA